VRSRSWKAAETRFARDVGTERKPCDGSRAGADFADGLCAYQLKIRRAIPGWLWDWLGGIQASAKASGRCGVLVLKKPRQDDSEAVVVLSWKDWVDLHGTSKDGGHASIFRDAL
jgi:hypothetical protein